MGAVPWPHKKIFEGQFLYKALLPLTSNATSYAEIVRGGAGHVREAAPREMRRTGQEQEWYLFIVLTGTLLLKKMPVMIQ